MGSETSEVRSSVANVLNREASALNDRMKQFSKIHLLFHKLAQFIQGHGFNTEAQWMEKLSQKLLMREKVEAFLSSPYHGTSEFITMIDGLTTNEFEQFLNDNSFEFIQFNPDKEKGLLDLLEGPKREVYENFIRRITSSLDKSELV